jgi:hypothetical protein
MTIELKQNLVCQMCTTNHYPYENNGLCVYQIALKESTPGGLLKKCPYKKEKEVWKVKH